MEQEAKQGKLVEAPQGWQPGDFVVVHGRAGTIKKVGTTRVQVRHQEDGGYERWYDLADLPDPGEHISELVKLKEADEILQSNMDAGNGRDAIRGAGTHFRGDA